MSLAKKAAIFFAGSAVAAAIVSMSSSGSQTNIASPFSLASKHHKEQAPALTYDERLQWIVDYYEKDCS